MPITKEKILKKLTQVLDPELGISIVDLGLIYDAKISKNNEVKITMTLTTPGCPLYSLIEEEIKNKIRGLGVKKVDVKITFSPLWTMDRVTKKGRKQLGI